MCIHEAIIASHLHFKNEVFRKSSEYTVWPTLDATDCYSLTRLISPYKPTNDEKSWAERKCKK